MKRLALLALIPFAATPALAGNVVPVAVEPVLAPVVVEATPVYEWSGAYVGIQGSYADVGIDGDVDGLDTELEDSGSAYGLRAGYDYDLGRTVVGGFVQYDKTDIQLEDSGIEIDDIFRLGARVGLDSNRNLYYATAGYAYADGENAGSADGFFAGLGYEVFLTQSITLGAEALYHDFGDFGDSDVDGGDVTTVGLNLNYRF